jgi:hypothetical protein
MLVGKEAAECFNRLFPTEEKQEKIARTLARMREIQASERDYCLKAALAGSWLAYLFGQFVDQLSESDQQAAREALQLYWDM